MAKKKIFTERRDYRFTKEHAKAIAEIANYLKTTENEAVRVIIFDYWKRM